MYDKNNVDTSPSASSLGNPFLEAALQYAGRGWSVFPLCPRSKYPWKGSHSFKDATTDRQQIEDWWSFRPKSNVAIATGQVSGLVVLDIDGDEGRQSLVQLMPWFKVAPGTAVVRTGRGYHIYMAGNIICRSSAGNGLDIRGEGGYVVAPPSIHKSGHVYTWTTT